MILLVVSACDRGSTPSGHGSSSAVTESAPPYAEWALDSVAAVSIGAVDGPPEYQFSRIGYAARLSDGRFVVYDGGSSELRWFGPNGDFLYRAGRRGEGPGEFLGVVSATVTPADSVVLYDFRNQRLSWYGPQGAFGGSLRLELGPMVTLAPFGDRLAISEEQPVFNLGGEEYNDSRDSLLVLVTAGDARQVDTLFHRLGREAVTWVEYTDGVPTGTRQFGLPFGHPTLMGATSESIVLIGDGESTLTLFNEQGEIARRARRSDLTPQPLSADLRREYVNHTVRTARARGFPEQPAAAGAAGLLDVIPEERLVGSFDRMLTDPSSGRIWVRDFVFEWNDNEAQRWTVYGSDGSVLGRVTTPPGLDVMHVSPNHAVGVKQDELGVEHVVAFQFDDSH